MKNVEKSFVVWPWDAAPENLRNAILEQDGAKQWIVVSTTENLEAGLPLWLDLMNPYDQTRVDLPGGVTLIGA